MTDAATPSYWIDGQTVDQERFYAWACDPARQVVVEACAGAGKTWMLVSRVLRALLDGVQPQEILAITFTRKAAAEMQQRLDQWLRELARATPEARVQALRLRGLDAEHARRLEPSLGDLRRRVLAGGRQVTFHTFHAWFAQLLRAAPMDALAELGLAPDLALLEEPDELMPDLWRAFHRRVQADPSLSRIHADLVGELGRQSVSSSLQATLQRRIEFERADTAATLEASVPSAVQRWPDLGRWPSVAHAWREPACLQALQNLARAWAGHPNKLPAQAAAAIGTALALAHAGAPDAQTVAALRAALLTKAGTLNKRLPEHPALSAVAEHLQFVEEAMEQERACAVHRQVVVLGRVLLAEYARIKRSRGLADMGDLELAALRLLRDGDLAAWIQERLDARVRQVLVDEFQDTSPLQWQALQAWLAAYAGAGGGASGQRPPGVFIVGDPKQSIYRFRRAEPRVFQAAQEFVVRGLGGARLSCDHTRRNAPGVLQALNRMFDAAGRAGEFTGFREHSTERVDCASWVPEGEACVRALSAMPERAAGGGTGSDDGEFAGPAEDAPGCEWRDSLRVPRVLADEVPRLKEGRQIATAVAHLLARGVPPGEIFVLARKRAVLRWVAEALREAGLPYVAPESRALVDAIEVRDLMALLDVLVCPHHDLSLAQVLRCPLFGVADTELLSLAAEVRSQQAAADAAGRVRPGWWEVLMGAGACGREGPLGGALARAAPLLARWREDALSLPPHDLLDRIVWQGSWRERLAVAVPAAQRAVALANLDAVLTQALRMDGGRYATAYNFVRALKRRLLKLPAAVSAEAVQLLTVHGAKGLEAAAVILADTDAAAPKAQTYTWLVDWPVERVDPVACAFLRSEASPPPALHEALKREQEARQREELNALYVAMTRARDLLVFSRCESKRRNSSASWWQRAQAVGVVSDTDCWQPQPGAHQPSSLLSGGQGGAEPLVSLPALPVPPPRLFCPTRPAGTRPDTGMPADGEPDLALRSGRAFHRLLQMLTRLPPSGREAAWDTAWSAACGEQALPEMQRQHVAHAVRRVLAAHGHGRLLDPGQAVWSGNEVELAHAGGVLRVDRLLHLDGEGPDRGWWVLDFKLEARPEQVPAYRDQIETYRQAVVALVGAAPVHCAFITAQGELVRVGLSSAGSE